MGGGGACHKDPKTYPLITTVQKLVVEGLLNNASIHPKDYRPFRI